MFEKQTDRQRTLVKQHVLQYSVIDGLLELAMGSVFLLIAVAVFLSNAFTNIFPPLIFLPVFLGIPLIFLGVSMLRRRITYPHTGYALPRYPRYLKPLVFFGLIVVSGLLTFLPLLIPNLQLLTDQIFVLFVGFLFTAILLWLGAGLTRFYILAAISFLLSIILVWLQLEQSLEYLIYCAVMGFSMLTSGALTLSYYLRKTRE